MRKLYIFLLGSLFVAGTQTTAHAQFSVLLNEDFESTTIPTGWSRTQNSGGTGWEFGITSYTDPDWQIPAHPAGGMFAAANDAQCELCDEGNDVLYAPVMDWTGYDSVLVLFDAYFDAKWGGEAIAQISYDGGTNWDTYGIPDVFAWQQNLGVTLDPVLDGPFTNNMVVRFVFSDLGAWADGFAIDNVAVLGFHDVCGDAINISCSQPQTVNFSGPGDLFWDLDECWATPGEEQLYQFTPPVTGTYHLNITSTNGEWVDYLWKPVSLGCDTGNWNCIEDVQDPEVIGALSLTAGVPIYIVADAEGFVATSQTFEIMCACSAPVMPSGTLENEACGDSINGGCNMVSPLFTQLACGETLVGNISTAGSSRDVDWFSFQVAESTSVTLTASGGFAMNLIIIDNCVNLIDFGFEQVAACNQAVITQTLAPGNYLAIVSPVSFEGYPCGDPQNNYWIKLEMGGPTVLVGPSPSVQVCEGVNTTLSTNVTGGTGYISYNWSTGGISDTLATLANVPGGNTYCVTVTDANGCLASSCASVTEVSAPSTDFSFTQNGFTVDYTDLSSPTPDYWLWNYSDGDSDLIANPSHTYAGPNGGTTYTSLIAIANPGCADTAAYMVNVSTSGCAPQFYLGPDVDDNLTGFDLDTASVTNNFVQLVSYTDNTGSPITVLHLESAYSLTFYGSPADYSTFGAWIDYNQNGTFETSELIGECASSGGTCTINFTVPAGSSLGNTDIRLISQEDLSSNLDPCANAYSYGEGEDYTVEIDDVVGSEEIAIQSLEVYPNPTEDVLNIVFQVEGTKAIEVRLTNTIGQVVFNDARSFFSGIYKNTVDASNLATGNYMLQVISEKGITNKKVVVK